MTLFRPCIDIHDGVVKQIVGSTLADDGPAPKTHFVATHSAAWYAERYRLENLRGGHVIKLGSGNDRAAAEALAAWPGGLHVGGGITLDNAGYWLDIGAEKVIVTSWLFQGRELDMARVRRLSAAVTPERLVIDLSCRATPDGWRVATDRWQTVTDVPVTRWLIERTAHLPFAQNSRLFVGTRVPTAPPANAGFSA